LCSRSSSDDREERFALGRITGHRGRGGEITVKVYGGDAASWEGVGRVWIEEERDGARNVEAARGYRDRLVLKLEGIDDSDRAARLKGRRVLVSDDEAPALPEGIWYTHRLVGLEVRDEKAGVVGRVEGILPTGGTDLLVVRAPEGDARGGEVLIPLAPEIVLNVDRAAGRIVVRLPEGLLDLNAPEARETE
jgi:16S rRNA processing protein RimM